MKNARTWGLLMVVAAVLTAFASPASATTGTSTEGTTFTFSAAAEGHLVMDNPIAKIECASAVTGKIESHGAGVTARGNLSALSFTNCTNSWHVTVVLAGWFEYHSIGSGDATVTTTGMTIEATRVGITCRYGTSSTDIGTLTDGTHATIDLSGALPFHGGSGLCGSGAMTWTGSYKVNSPTNLSFDA